MLSGSTLRVLSIFDCSNDNDRAASGSVNGDRVYGRHVIRCCELGSDPNASSIRECSDRVFKGNLVIASGKWSKPFHRSSFTTHTDV